MCGMINCCEGQACPACVADAEALLATAGELCLKQCPPVDVLDALCMEHDFCVSAQLHRNASLNALCTTTPPFTSLHIPANGCDCDLALYTGLNSFPHASAFAGNLRLWLTSRWGHCFTLAQDGSFGQCLSFQVAVAPGGSSGGQKWWALAEGVVLVLSSAVLASWVAGGPVRRIGR